MARPNSIAEVAALTRAGEKAFDLSLREFVDAWQTMSPFERASAIAQEPERIGAVQDAYLGATAEYLASVFGMDAPDWTKAPERFLREPFFAGGLESLKATLLVESPTAFRRRLIFVSANALSRPNREFIQDNALYVANLDL